MRTDKDKIKDIFSSKLTGFEPSVPDNMWDKIAKELPASTSSHPVKKVSLVKKIVTISVSVAAAIMLFLVLTIPESKDPAKQLSENLPIDVLSPSFIEENNINNIATNNTEESTNNTRPQNHTQSRLISLATKQSTDNTFSGSEGEDKNTANNLSSQKEPSQKTDNTTDKETIEDKIKEFANQGKSLEKSLSQEIIPSKKENKGISLSLGGNTSFSNTKKETSIANSLRSMNIYHNEEMQTLADVAPILEKELPADIDHNQPVSFGITVSKNLNEKFAIETGLVYTYLSSKIKSTKDSGIKRNDTQHFHYLGVPVSLNYNFAKWGKAEFYASAGGMIQKDFHGRYKEYQASFNKEGQANQVLNKKKIHQDNLQVSVLGKIGATYPIYDKMHVYATVGGGYYFDANNEYKTIYSDKKVQLDLNIGIKFKF